MEAARSTDTFVVRVRRERNPGGVVERWQVEHVQTGLRVYVHGLDEAMSLIRTSLSRTGRPNSNGPDSEPTQ